MTRIVVQKYGGSSVADVERIRGVAARVAATYAEGHAVCVVVSAMGNTTNDLLALARQVADRPDRRELDMLISVGERITMALLAMCLRARGVPARSLTGSQSGIVTDETHADARVVEVRPERLKAVLDGGEVAIVSGFQGVSRTREVTTLGRGGSDTTAVVLAAALGAEHAEICSDVDGVFSADPRIVSAARKLDDLSLDEALALARGGAKVLFEDAVRYARDHGVTVVASSTFGPGSGTRLVPGPVAPRIVAVTGDAQLVRVRLAATDVEQLGGLASSGGRVRRSLGDVHHVDVRNAHGGLPASFGAEPIAVISAVGSGLGERPLDVARGTVALLESGIVLGERGMAGDAAWWEVPPWVLDQGVKLVHGALIEG